MSVLMQAILPFLILTAGETMVCAMLFKGRFKLAALLSLLTVAACVTQRAEGETFTNMPASCVGISTDLTGKPLSQCPTSNQKFMRAAPETWVRVCVQVDDGDPNTPPPGPCSYSTMQWQRWTNAKNGSDKIDVCSIAKEPGTPSAGTGASCSTTGTGYSGMKQVSPYDVNEVPPLPPQAAFTVTPTSGAAPLNVTVAWNVANMPSGTPCQAQSVGLTSNAAGPWHGPKAAVGSEQISSLMESTRFTLNCVYSKDIAVVVSWTPPTTNTDGTPFTDASGYTVVYGQSPQEMASAANAASNVSSLLVQDFYFKAEQTWYFAVKARSSGGNESDPSNIVSVKLVQPGDVTAPFASSVTATVTGHVPNPPTNASAQQVDVEPSADGTQQIVTPPEVQQRKLKRAVPPEQRRRER